jgi:hypothetical protein
MLTPTGYGRFRLANTEFIPALETGASTPACFYVQLPKELVAEFGRLRKVVQFGRILQITRDPGGAALTILVGAPRRLVVATSADKASSALYELASRRGYDDELRVITGVDVEDEQMVRGIATDEFDDGAIDVVIDDASRTGGPARALFEAVFPGLPAGSHYLLQNWASAHRMFQRFAEAGAWSASEREERVRQGIEEQGQPLEALVPLLVAAARRRPDAIAGLVVMPQWIDVVRGPGGLEDGSLRLDPVAAPDDLDDREA